MSYELKAAISYEPGTGNGLECVVEVVPSATLRTGCSAAFVGDGWLGKENRQRHDSCNQLGVFVLIKIG